MTYASWPCVAVVVLIGGSLRADSAREIIDLGGVKGGVIVHVGCGSGELTAEL